MAGPIIGLIAAALPEIGAGGAAAAAGGAAEVAGGAALTDGAGALAANETIGGELAQVVGAGQQGQSQLAAQISQAGAAQRQAAQSLEQTASKDSTSSHEKDIMKEFEEGVDTGEGDDTQQA